MWDRVEFAEGTGNGAQRTAAGRPSFPHAALDRIVALAADLFSVPTSGLVLCHGARAILASVVGLDAVPWRHAWSLFLSEDEPSIAPDLAGDSRLPGNSAAVETSWRFRVGTPVVDADGARLGTLYVMAPDVRPDPSPVDMDRLAALAAMAGDAVAAHRARERAEMAAEAKAALLADVSHEMRTPLNAIRGFTQLLRREGALSDEASEAVGRIDEAGRSLLAIVGDVLDLSRLESGLVRLEPRAFSLSRLVEDSAAMLRADAERKGLRLLVDLPTRVVGPVLGDPERLRQVILNLLSNAVKFTTSGTVRIALGSGRAIRGVVPITVSVEDSGVGIAADAVPQLFRRFAQADGTVARRFGGTGLGLAISKSLVDAMGGRISVDSVPGQGTRFAVSLTLPRASDPALALPEREDGPGERDELRGLAILVAEDAAMNQKLVLQILEPLGADVDVVADGAAAVAAVKRRDYALVLMDMQMPVLDGLDATRQIRALGGSAARVPIVALTANVFPEQLDLCREAGMDDHLTKPFGAGDLADTALRWARPLVPADDGGA